MLYVLRHLCLDGYGYEHHSIISQHFRYLPVTLIKVLSQQLDRWLSSVNLLLWHVQIINKYDTLLPHGWTKHTFTPSVKLSHDDELSLVGAGLG